MAKYAFVVAATRGYEEPVRVFISSVLKHHGKEVDIHLLYLDMNGFPVPENVYTFEIPRHGNQLLMNYIWRLKYAGVLRQYDAVCMVDADMFCVRDLTKYFDIAAKANLIIGASDCVNIWYEESYRNHYPNILTEDFYNTKTITSVPLFFSPRQHGAVFENVYNWGITHGVVSDLTVMNMFLCRDKHSDLMVLPAHAWTGIHHTFFKPELRVRRILGRYVSEAGDEIQMIHGRWFDPRWIEGLRTTMAQYFADILHLSETGLQKYMALVDDSIQVCLDAYESYREGPWLL